MYAVSSEGRSGWVKRRCYAEGHRCRHQDDCRREPMCCTCSKYLKHLVGRYIWIAAGPLEVTGKLLESKCTYIVLAVEGVCDKGPQQKVDADGSTPKGMLEYIECDQIVAVTPLPCPMKGEKPAPVD